VIAAPGTAPPATALPPAAPVPTAPTKRRYWKPRLIPEWDKNPRVVSQAATLEGKLALLGLFGLVLFLSTPLPLWSWMMAVLVATSLLPEWRRNLVTAGTLGTAILAGYLRFRPAGSSAASGPPIPGLATYAAALTAILIFGLLLFTFAAKWPRSGVMKRPVLSLNILFVALALAAAVTPLSKHLQSGVQFTVILLAGYLWYFAYSLQDRLASGRDSAFHQIGTWAPFWVNASGAGTPFCKGAAYLRRIEAKTPEELAITQIKGLKLLVWCLVLRIATAIFFQAALQPSWGLALPALDGLIQTGRFPAWYMCWASLLADFAYTALSLAIWGNTIVACCRMAGFRALRNTYRPLQAASIAEFWNRYYYYFKELLVDFFFYPVYTRYFKRHRRVRMFAATLAAATAGNIIYHFLRDIDFVFTLGPWKAIAGFRVYAVYTLLLGCGIGISQLRKPHTAPNKDCFSRVLAATRVIGFFCLLHIFDYTGRDHSITQHGQFLLHLFNLG
jgi:hypothetical protein